MSSSRLIRTRPLQQMPSSGDEVQSPGGIRWLGWIIALVALCALVVPAHVYSADSTFNFDDFTKGKSFKLNTIWTTPFGPPWADIVLKKENFLACKGAEIALCYYSGPEQSQTGGAATPCDVSNPLVANCTCYAIPAGHTYFVDINAILNLDVYLDTVKACGSDGSGCQPTGPKTAPVCDSINQDKLIPGADLISTFSLALVPEFGLGSTDCGPAAYAGCMTAPCRKLNEIDPKTRLPLAQCACPLWTGKYQVGQTIPQTSCSLGGSNVWSAAFSPAEELIPPPPPPPHHCWPDSPADVGCPLLPRDFLPGAQLCELPAGVQRVQAEQPQRDPGGFHLRCDALHDRLRSRAGRQRLPGARETQRLRNPQAGDRGRVQLFGQPGLRV